MNAPAREPPAGLTLRQQLGIETPEHVALHLELAGLGSRAAAALVDTLVAGSALLVLLWLINLLGLAAPGGALTGWILAVIIDRKSVV